MNTVLNISAYRFVPLPDAAALRERIHAQAAEAGLYVGLAGVLGLFAASKLAPGLYAALNPLDLQIGFLGLVLNSVTMVLVALLTPPMAQDHLRRFEL